MVEVQGNKDPATAWIFASSCPGKALNNAHLQTNVRFHWGANPNGGSSGTAYECQFTLLLDGIAVQNVPMSQNYSYQKKMYDGHSHSYSYSNVTCRTTIGGVPYNTWIKIGNGLWTSGHPTPANGRGGEINL